MYNQDKKIVDRREMLRIKVKSLMEEARIIRKDERRTYGELRDEMHQHRVGVVRSAARNAHIAYGIIRGRTIDEMEPIRYTEPDWEEVQRMVRKYGSVEFRKWERHPTPAVQETAVSVEAATKAAPGFFGRLLKAS